MQQRSAQPPDLNRVAMEHALDDALASVTPCAAQAHTRCIQHARRRVVATVCSRAKALRTWACACAWELRADQEPWLLLKIGPRSRQ
eukprot:12321700-Alexandrium_andersonii.AAC.1